MPRSPTERDTQVVHRADGRSRRPTPSLVRTHQAWLVFAGHPGGGQAGLSWPRAGL